MVDWQKIYDDVKQVLKEESVIREKNFYMIRNYFAVSTVDQQLVDLDELKRWNVKLNADLEDHSKFLRYVEEKSRDIFCNYIGEYVRPNIEKIVKFQQLKSKTYLELHGTLV